MTVPFRLPPVYLQPGARPYSVAPLSVQGDPVNPLEAAVVAATLPPDLQALARRAALLRTIQFGHDAPAALPAGLAGLVGSTLTDIASLKAPFLPPIFPGVKTQGDQMTRTLMNHINKLTGAAPGTSGTDTGEDWGAMLGSQLLPLMADVVPEGTTPAEAPPRPVVGIKTMTANDVAPVLESVPDFASLKQLPDGLYHVEGNGIEPSALVQKSGRTLTQLRAHVQPTAAGYDATTIPIDRDDIPVTRSFPVPLASHDVDAMHEALQANGGFTYDPQSRQMYAGDGYGVSNPEGAVRPDPMGRSTPADLQDMLKANARMWQTPGMMFGGWKDPETGLTHLDVTEVVPDRAEALARAKARGELAVHHYGSGTTITTPGDALPPNPEGGFARVSAGPQPVTLSLTHISHVPDLTSIDPAKAGTGIIARGAERSAGRQGAHFFDEKSPGRYEDAFRMALQGGEMTKYGARITAPIYDIGDDPEGIWSRTLGQGASDAEFRRQLTRAGYAGYRNLAEDPGAFKRTIVMIRKVPVTPR